VSEQKNAADSKSAVRNLESRAKNPSEQQNPHPDRPGLNLNKELIGTVAMELARLDVDPDDVPRIAVHVCERVAEWLTIPTTIERGAAAHEAAELFCEGGNDDHFIAGLSAVVWES